MILAPRDPQSIREWFKRRQFESWVILGGVFLFFAYVFSWITSKYFQSFVPMVLGDGLAALIACYVGLRWNRQPMRVRCDECGGSVDCRTPWVCGQCGHENWNVNKFPFIRYCEECLIAPKSYICHHSEEGKPPCEAHIFFSEDHDKSNPAHRITKEGLKAKKREKARNKAEQKFEERKRDLQKAHEEKKQAVESAKLDLVVEQIKAQIKAAERGASEIPVETALNMYVEALKQFLNSKDAIREAARIATLEAEAFKKDRPRYTRRINDINAWTAEEFAKVTKNPTQK